MTALSMEVRQKLESIRPRTIGQAGRIDGMTPAALTLARRPCPARRRGRKRAAALRTDDRVRPGRKPSRCSATKFHVKHGSGSTASSSCFFERQEVMNLIAPSTIPTIWTRHIADSLQLLPLAPNANRWIDFGSGAGLPGIVIACALAKARARRSISSKARRKKRRSCGTLSRRSALPAVVHARRIEDFARAGHHTGSMS